MAVRPQELWAELNERQQTYLKALYECDQAKETERRIRAAKGDWFDRRPASEWRWVMYGPVAPSSRLYDLLRTANLVDPGTGATWQALEDRGLVLTRILREPLGKFLQVQITTFGRKVVRAGTGEQRQKLPPKGQLRERQWAALAALYVAGNEGLGEFELVSFDWWYTLRRLEDYKPKALIESPRGNYSRRIITEFGRFYYEQEWQRYRELYPNVEVSEPPKGNKQ